MADNLDPELQRQLNEELEKFKESVSGMVPAMVLMTAAMKEQIAASKGLSGAEKDGKSVVENWLKAQAGETQATKEASEATKKYNEAMDNLNKALYSGAASLAGFGKALMTTGGGMTKYTGAVDSAGDAMLSLGKAGGPLGLAFGFLGKAISKIVGSVLEYNDNTLKGTDALAKFGVIGDITTDKFKQMGSVAGYSVQRLEELAGIYKELGPDLLALGGTATTGAKAFTKLIEADEVVLQQFSRLGISQNQLNKNQADYIKLQIASGQQITERSKQDGSLRKASLEYTNNLLELSAITGMDVEELKKKQVLAAADQAFATKLAMMQDEELELRARAKTENNKELEAKADSIKTDREAKETMLKLGVAMGMTGDQLKGFTHVLASGSYNEVSASFLRMGVDITEFEKGLASGTKTQYDFVDAMAQGVKRNRSQIGTAITLDKELANMFGNTTEMMGLSTKLAGKSKDEQQKLITEELENRKKQMQGGVDAAKDARAQQETTERTTQRTFDSLIGIMQGPLTKAFENLQSVINSFSKWVASTVDRVTGSNLSDMFKSLSEVREDKDKNAKQIDKITKQIKIFKALPRGRGMGASIAPLERQRLELLEKQKVLEQREATLDTAPKPAATSANTSSGMTGYLKKIAQVESSGKAGAKSDSSSASGLFQFTKDTWEENVKAMGKNYSLADRSDPQKSAEVAKYFTEKQKKQLQTGTGKENVSDADLYMAHFLGAGGATKFLNAMAKNPSALATEGAYPKQIEANKSIFYEDGGEGKMRTLQEVYDLMSRKIDKAGETIAAGKGGEDIGKIQQGRFGGVFSGSESGYPVMLHGKEIVIPMPDTNSLDVKKTELGEAGATSNTTQTVTENNTVDNMKVMYDMIDMLSAKLDSVVDHLATGNDYTDQLLKYSRV